MVKMRLHISATPDQSVLNEGSFFVVLQLVWMSTDLLQKLTWFGGGDWGSERELMQQ